MRMKRSVILTAEPIDEPALVKGREMSAGMGAAVYFSGVVRGSEGEKAIRAIEYEAFERMVLHQFDLIFAGIERRCTITIQQG